MISFAEAKAKSIVVWPFYICVAHGGNGQTTFPDHWEGNHNNTAFFKALFP